MYAIGVTLLAMGSARYAFSEPLALQSLPTPQSRFLTIGYGLAVFSGVGGDSRDGEVALTAQLGQSILPTLQVTEELSVYSGSPQKANQPPVSINHSTFLAGIRWVPFSRSARDIDAAILPIRYVDESALYGRLSLGLDVKERLDFGAQARDSTALAPALNVAVGWLPLQGADVALGFEVREQMARYDLGFENSFSILLLMQIAR